jgi:hypothetical protein
MNTLKMHRKYGIVTNFLDTMLEHEVVIQEGETKLDAFRRGLKELDQIAADLRKETHPHLYQETTDLNKKWVHAASEHMQQTNAGLTTLPTISQQTEPETDNLTAIQNAATLEELKSFKLLAAGDKALYTAYCQRIKELTP